MKAQFLGIVVSVFFHSLLGFAGLGMDYLGATRQKPLCLDFSLTYDFVPKGNSMDSSLLTPDQKKHKKNKQEKISSLSQKIKQDFNDAEKKYGVKNGNEDADETFIRENLNKIRARIQNQIVYPPIAKRMGWYGKANISFLLTQQGEIQNIKLEKSTGYPVLDNCAIRIIKSLTDLPRPSTLTRISVPFSFSLNTIN